METLIKKIEQLMDWFNKFFSRIKGFGYIIAVIIMILFVINNGCRREHAEQLIEKITGLNVQKDLLLKENKEIEKRLKEKEALIKIKNSQIDSVNILQKREKEIAEYWKRKHNEIARELSQITSDSVYQVLQLIYAYPGEFKYLFNEPQIRSMYATYLENENKTRQIYHIESALNQCEEKTYLLESKISLKDEQFKDRTFQYKNLDEIMDLENQENELLRKELKKKKFWGNVKNVGIGIAFIAGLII